MDAKPTANSSESSSNAPGKRAERRRRPTVLVDANALLLPFTGRFRLEEEVYRLVDAAEIKVPASVLGELDRVAGANNPRARAAREYARRFPVAATDLRGDEAILELARKLPAWVVTGDRALRQRLVEAGVPVLFPRGETHLDLAWSPRKYCRAARRKRPGSGKRYVSTPARQE